MSLYLEEKYEPPHASLTLASVEAIEIALEMSLPEHYREALMHNPFKGSELDENLFWNYTDAIIARNILNWKSDWYGREWPKNALQIGSSCDGGAVFISLSAEDTSVYFYHWEMAEDLAVDERLKVSASIPEFIVVWKEQDQY